MKKDVRLPSWLKEGVKPLKNRFPKRPNLMVFDTETEEGKPYLLTFYDGNKPSYLRVKERNILRFFMHYLLDCCSKHKSNILFAHNLEFDIGAVLCHKWKENFFWLKPPLFNVYDNILEKETYLGVINLFYQKTWFAQIRLRNNANVKVVDSNNFVRGTLWRLSRDLGFEHKKYDRPFFVTEGRKPKNRREWNMLLNYCGREIKATYELAEYILNLHRDYDVGYAVSIPHLGSKVFRKHFLEVTIPQIPHYAKTLVELSIHGGRSDSFVSTPVVIPHVKMYDYNSFYPYAMAMLPPMTKGKWFRVKKFDSEHEGFYLISGFVKKCRYPILIKSSSGMTYANNEKIKNVSVTSYELREALRSGEVKIDKIRGYVWKPSSKSVNPFKNYIEHFYKRKREAETDTALYMANKLLLNAIYGKTYQAVRLTDYQETPEYVLDKKRNTLRKSKIKYRGGGLYLPHVGSWITSMCRAILHSDFHRYEAIDCATDSFKTLKDVPEGSNLGELKRVCEGLLLLIRPKLYVMFSKEREKEILDHGNLREWLKENVKKLDDLDFKRGSKVDIVKFALHGFWGNCFQLLSLYKNKNVSYDFKHMTKIRESLKQKKYPRVMEHGIRSIHVEWKDEKGLCGLRKEEALKSLEMCSLNCFSCAHSDVTMRL